MNGRKIILIIAFIVISLLMLWGIYYFFFVWTPDGAPGEEIPGSETGQLPGVGVGGGPGTAGGPGTLPGTGVIGGGGLPGGASGGTGQLPEVSDVANGGLTRAQLVTADVARDPAVQVGGRGLVYYNANDGKFYRVEPDGGEKTAISQDTFYSVEHVVWSNDQTKAVLEYPDGANVVYDFIDQRQVTLPSEAQDFSFSSDGQQIAYEYIGGGERENWLTVANADGTEAEFVQELGARADQVEISWSPARNVVALFRKSAGLSSEEIIPLGLNQENFKSFTVEGTHFDGIWAPRGDRMVYHVLSPNTDFNPTLWTVDVYGENVGTNHYALGLVTWVDKCTFNQNGTKLYCAVPQGLPQGAGIERAIVDASITDDVYMVDLATGLHAMLARPVNAAGGGVQVARLMVGASEESLFLWDALSQSVLNVRLK